jgi:hypothetical protein
MKNRDEKQKREPAAVVKERGMVVTIYEVKAASTKSGISYRFKVSGQKPVNRTDLDEAKLEAKRAITHALAGVAHQVKASDITELIAARKLANELDTPLLPAVQEWARAKELTGPALLSIAQEHANAIAEGKHKRVTHAAAWEAFIAAKEANGKKAIRTYTSKAKMIQKGHGADIMLDTITSEKVAAWSFKVADPITRNDLLKRLGTLIKWCQRNKLWPLERAIPTASVDRAEPPEKEPGIINAYTLKRILDYLRAHYPEYLAATAIAALAGVRSDEVHGKRSDKGKERSKMPRQRWEHIHLRDPDDPTALGYLLVTVAKKNTPSWRKVPLDISLIKWLELAPRNGEFVCIAGAMERVREIIRKADRDFGLPKVETVINGEKVMVNDLPENAFRHSYITFSIPLVGVTQTAAAAGNSPSEIERSYRVPMTKAPALKWFAVRPD